MATKQSVESMHRAAQNVVDFPSAKGWDSVGNYCPGEFRIAREKRGELIVGFRVQEYRYRRNVIEQGVGEHRWMNIGRRVFTVDAARDLLEFTKRQRGARMLPPAEYETVE